MTSSPKRPWFRFHLLTALATMLAVGAFATLNCMTSQIEVRTTHMYCTWTNYGWPFKCCTYVEKSDVSHTSSSHWIWLASNLLCSFLLVILIGLAVEALLRRREARKP